VRGAQQVLRGVFNELRVAEGLNERLGFSVRERNFAAESKSSASPFGPLKFRFAHCWALPSGSIRHPRNSSIVNACRNGCAIPRRLH
jgi:hypothetical protein